MTSLPTRLKKVPLPRLLILLFLLLLLGFGMAPAYFGGTWPWEKQPGIPSAVQKQLNSIPKRGIDIPGWETVEFEKLRMSDRNWSVQRLKQTDANPQIAEQVDGNVLLLLSSQKYVKDHPAVEWTDMNSHMNNQQRWKADRLRHRTFSVQDKRLGEIITVKARFLRGWTDAQTFAVLQWYAWPEAGHSSVLHWFWADQLAQWKGYRQTWVAVCLLIPTEPLVEDLEPYWPIAESLGQAVQTKLMEGPLQKLQPQ